MRIEIEESLDQVTLEEAEELVNEFKDTTIESEIQDRIIKKGFEKAGVTEEVISNKKRKRKYSRWIQVAAALTFIVMIGTTTAYAMGALDNLSQYFSGDVKRVEDKLSKTIKAVSNGLCKIEIQGAVFDDNVCLFAFNVKGEGVCGKSYVKVLGLDNVSSNMKITARFKDGTESKLESVTTIRSSEYKGSVVVPIADGDFDGKDLEEVENIKIGYDNMEIVLEKENIGEMIPLRGKASSKIKNVEMSSIALTYHYDEIPRERTQEYYQELIKNGEMERYESDEVILLKKDGTEEKQMGLLLDGEEKNGYSCIKDYDGKIINLDDYRGVRINGEEFLK